jgi:glycosyltransferase involved in cell wall biosynthesis
MRESALQSPSAAPAASATLVLLSFDEREALERLLPVLPIELFERVFAVDGGSTDGTLDLYRAHSIPCFVQDRPGRGNAFLFAERLLETDRVVFLSADGNEDPADLPRMLHHLDEGYDMVIGGRFVLPGSCTDDSDDPIGIRRLGSMTYGAIVRAIWRTDVYDACNGYRAFRTEAMRRMKLDAPLHEIELQSTIRAAKLGLRVKEFPTRELERMGGFHKKTAATFTLAWRTGFYLMREIVLGNRPLARG